MKDHACRNAYLAFDFLTKTHHIKVEGRWGTIHVNTEDLQRESANGLTILDFIDMARRRIKKEAGMFAEVT